MGRVKGFNGLKHHKKSQFLFRMEGGKTYYYNYGSEGNTNKWTYVLFSNSFGIQSEWKQVTKKTLEKIEKKEKEDEVFPSAIFRLLDKQYKTYGDKL